MLKFDQIISRIILKIIWRAMQEKNKRRSTGNARNKFHKLEQILPQLTSKEYLTKNSLFANLYSSEPFKLQIQENQFMTTAFGKVSLCENELHELNYFHLRDKKVILFNILLLFLLHGGKAEILIMQNSDRIDKSELQQYLCNPKYGGNDKMLQEYSKRVIWYFAITPLVFKFNLQYLPLLLKERQFVKCVIISDINTFETSEKASLERLYKKIPKQLAIVSFRQDFYDYKLIQKTVLPYRFQQEEGQDEIYQINERASNALNRKHESFKSNISLIVPVELIGAVSKTVEEAYRIALIRKNPMTGRYLQFSFSAPPFKLQTFRQI